MSPQKTTVIEPITVSGILTIRITEEHIHESRTQSTRAHQHLSVRREIIVDIDPKADLRYRSPQWPQSFSDTRAERVTVILVDDDPPQVRLEARSLLRKARRGHQGALRTFKIYPFRLTALRTIEEGRFSWLPDLVDRAGDLELHHDA